MRQRQQNPDDDPVTTARALRGELLDMVNTLEDLLTELRDEVCRRVRDKADGGDNA